MTTNRERQPLLAWPGWQDLRVTGALAIAFALLWIVPPRPQRRVSLGNRAAGLGLQALMDFRAELALDGETLSDAEWRQVLAAGDGLVRLKGRWVEVDQEKLGALLEHWKKVQRTGGGRCLLPGGDAAPRRRRHRGRRRDRAPRGGGRVVRGGSPASG
jgi:hypothetical protein